MTAMFTLFFLFARISLFTFGGGYAMIPLFQSELVERCKLLSPEDFANLVALAQMTPGPVGMNAATYIGYQQGMAWAGIPGGILGAAFSTLGVMAPSLILMTLAAMFLTAFKTNRYVKAVLTGVRPVTIGLISAAVIFFANISIFTAPLFQEGFGLCWQGCVVFAVVLILQLKWKINLFLLLLLSVVLGILLFLF